MGRRPGSRVPDRLLRAVGLLATAAAAVVLWSLRGSIDGLPRRELLFAFMVYLVGPGGLALAVSTLVPRRLHWVVSAALVTHLAGAAIFLVYAVNLGVVAP